MADTVSQIGTIPNTMMTFLFDNDIATVTSLSSLIRHVVFLISANTIVFALHMFIIDVQDSVVR